MSLARLGQLEPDALRQAAMSLVPPRALEHVRQLGPLRGRAESAMFRCTLDEVTGELHVRVPATRVDRDYALSLDLEEAGAGQLRLGFIIINDLSCPRYDIDVMPDGALTLLGTSSRHIEAELAAMQAGLGPAQVRCGLRLFAEVLPRLETFAQRLGYVAVLLEPLTYHNAIMYERYGFAYVSGRKRMQRINEAFRPGGVLHAALDSSSPFRLPELARTPRGRSWAIHDGILETLDGDEHLGLTMVKPIGVDAGQRTFDVEGPTSKVQGPRSEENGREAR